MAFSFFKKKSNTSDAGQATDANSNKQNERYYTLKVREVVNETADAVSLHFDHPNGQPIQYKAGQFYTLIFTIDGQKVRRAYSLSSSPFTDQYPAVTVKRVEKGLVSNYINDTIKAGDAVEIMEPLGTFTTEFKPDNKRHLILFGGGSGITPLMSILKSTLDQEPESIVSLIYANRNEQSIIFKARLDALTEQYADRLKVVHVLDNAPLQWQGPSGLLNEEMLKGLLADLPDWGKASTTYLMCGPEGMMYNVETMLDNLGIDKDRVFKESFVSTTINKKEEAAAGAATEAMNVTVHYEGEAHTFAVEPDATILQTALDLDIDLPFSCQSGLCTACRGKCTSGKVNMDETEGLSDAELEEGYVLTCVGHPATNDVVIEIG